MAPPIMAVPPEILQLILGHLGVGEVVSCTQTCGKWNSLLQNDWSFLEQLDLSHYYKAITPKVFESIVSKFNRTGHNLRVLNLKLCVNLDETSIRLAISRFPNIEELNISYCRLITHNAIEEVLNNCCKLRNFYFKVRFTNGYSMKNLMKIVANAKNDRIESLVLPYHVFPINAALPIFERYPKLAIDPYFIKYVIRHVVESDTISTEDAELLYRRALSVNNPAVVQALLVFNPFLWSVNPEYISKIVEKAQELMDQHVYMKRYLLNFMEDNIHLLNYEQRQLKNRLKENEADIDRQTEQFYTDKHYNKLVEYKKHPRAYKCLKMGEAEKFDRLTRSGKLQEAEDFIQKTVYSLSITKRKMKKLKLLRALAYHRRGKLEMALDVYLELLKFHWKSQSYLYQCIWAAYHAAKLLKYEEHAQAIRRKMQEISLTNTLNSQEFEQVERSIECGQCTVTHLSNVPIKTNQFWYFCSDCALIDMSGLCATCSQTCHSGHNTFYYDFRNNCYCDCKNHK